MLGDFLRDGHNGHHLKQVKKLVIIGGIVVLLFVVFFIVFIVWIASWLFNHGEESLRQTTQSVSEQVAPLRDSFDLSAYISNNQVDVQKIRDTYEALPSQARSLWLDQFSRQLDELKRQAGVSDQTIQALTDAYNSLRQLQ